MIIDSHCHLPGNLEEAEKEISSAKNVGVVRFINIGTSLENSADSIRIANIFEEVYATAGIFPQENIDKKTNQLEHSLIELIKSESSKKLVGIGECGIDITNRQSRRELKDQIILFEMQLSLAQKFNLPVVIHNRDGDNYIFESLSKYPNVKGVAHCFASSMESAEKFLKTNFIISFSGLITYPSRKDLLEVVKEIPFDKFIVETDSPYLPPQGHRGEKNSSKYVRIIVEKIAETKKVPFELICKQSYQNTCKLFQI